jgi:pimeloyl-ACP methyl ester carboxylesterase
MLNTFRTRGVARSLLESDTRVSVRRSEGVLAFVPTSAASAPGLVFIVGAGVAPEAYAPLLRPIAEQSHPVFVVALPYWIAPLEEHKALAVVRARTILESEPAAAVWVVAGHSLGGALACRIALHAPSRVKAAVLIGTSHPKTDDLSRVRLPITKVVGTLDGVATPEMVAANKHLLPAATQWVQIEGGNHSQFGHYGHQLFDRTPTLSREEQQSRTRAALLDALREETAKETNIAR